MIPDRYLHVLHEFYWKSWARACLHLSGQAVKVQESILCSLLLAGMCLWLLVSYLPWMKSLHSSKMGHLSWMTVTRVWWQPTRCRSIFTKQQHSQLQLSVAGWCISWLQWLILRSWKLCSPFILWSPCVPHGFIPFLLGIWNLVWKLGSTVSTRSKIRHKTRVPSKPW